MTVEEKAEEGLNKRLGTMGYLNKQNVARPYTDGYKDGYHECEKEHEWHYVKNGDLPKEEKEYFVYSEEWGYEIKKFLVDVGYFECRQRCNITKWKETE